MEKNNGLLIAGGLLVVVAVVASCFSFHFGKDQGARSMHMGMMHSSSQEKSEYRNMSKNKMMDHKEMTMEEMTKGLERKTGDAFDRAFIEMMIVHHEGAVDMARLIPANAKHEELKKLGQDIITAQTKEIEMMKQWMKDWGYTSSSEKTEKQMMDEMMPGMQH